jgi:PTS system galactitol-specific IIA component
VNETESLLDEELVLIDYEAKNKEELLKSLASILHERGYVKESYINGVLERERVFPTGLNTDGVKVALPHTDAKHVNKAVILFAKLKEPIIFKEMGLSGNDVEARLIFMMAVKNPEEQVKCLGNLMSILSKKEMLISLYESSTKSEVIEKLSKVLYKNI